MRIGTRGSTLALWQAEHVHSRLATLGHASTLHPITTTGDRLLDQRLDSVGGKGSFLKEIEEALLDGAIDLAVHSLKDVPTKTPDGLRLCAFLERADARDALISGSGAGLTALPPGARLGSASLRRKAQILILRPDLSFEDLRGNVETRLRRLRDGAFDAIVLAMAGLVRLGRQDAVSEILATDRLLPAPGQGVIAIECRDGDRDVSRIVAPLNHAATESAVMAERAFLAGIGGECNVPLGAYAEPIDGRVRLRALVANEDGSRFLRGEQRGADPIDVGRRLAEEMVSQGAGELLSAVGTGGSHAD
ncbi:MAG: hydroxymethylbilane synthase [Vicinamibacteria bacterium]|nr:hydroxymethylbilane synthase [Vicinamibacteria bacterium]